MLVAEVIVPQMFTAYAEDLGHLDNGLHHYQYYCEDCDQLFASAWGKIQGSMSWFERGAYFHCPHCGKRHEKNVVVIKRQVPAPYKIRLSVKVYENVVSFEIFSNTLEFQDNLKVHRGSCKEIFRFDIAKQTVLWSSCIDGYKRESVELGNPYKLDVLEKSIIGSFLPYSLANSMQKAELNKILKVLRESVHSRLEKRLKHKVSSMFVSPGQRYGTLLLPIFNIAYRVTFPDAPNLPSVYRESQNTIRHFWSTKMVSTNLDFMDEVIALTKRKTDFITAMATANSLPDKPFIRRVITEDPFVFNLLVVAFSLCENYDYATRLYTGLRKLGADNYSLNEELIQFLRTVLPLYGEEGIVRLVENAKDMQLGDCIRLYRQLNDENRLAIETERVKLNDLHDWMARVHRRQTHVNLKFDVPNHIVKRLSMQKNRLKFFLPEESLELLEAGAELHNCVASYGTAMKDNSKWVVLVADDKGKLAACLEVQGKELVQAKIDKNKPVSHDAKLNNEVIAWAKKAKIEIKTSDISVHTEDDRITIAG